jgi:hypothetical protein
VGDSGLLKALAVAGFACLAACGPSHEDLAVEDPGANSSNCGEGYSCVYTNTISWQTPTRPLPMEINPQVVFERMFGDGGTPELREAR